MGQQMQPRLEHLGKWWQSAFSKRGFGIINTTSAATTVSEAGPGSAVPRYAHSIQAE
jgi:hypothetical protein